MELTLWEKQLTKVKVAHFPTLKSLGNVEATFFKDNAKIISDWRSFDTDRRILMHLIQNSIFPLIHLSLDIGAVSADMYMELAELQSDTAYKQKHLDIEVPEFYKCLSWDTRYESCGPSGIKIVIVWPSLFETPVKSYHTKGRSRVNMDKRFLIG